MHPGANVVPLCDLLNDSELIRPAGSIAPSVDAMHSHFPTLRLEVSEYPGILLDVIRSCSQRGPGHPGVFARSSGVGDEEVRRGEICFDGRISINRKPEVGDHL